MSALTIVQDAMGRLGLQQPSVLFSSTDQQVIQFRSLLNQEGKTLTDAGDWVELQTQWEFSTVATAIQTSAIPSDFDHILNGSMWDRTSDRPVYGPLNAQEWQREKAGPTFTSVYYAFRIRGTDMLFTPTPASGLSVFYEYVTNQWAETAGGTGITAFTADDDVTKLDPETMTLGVIWRFLKAKGLEYEQAKKDYDERVADGLAHSGGAPILNLGYTMPYRRYQPNVPEANWP
jgi:hypothetical protein